jgi:hypothetical protein
MVKEQLFADIRELTKGDDTPAQNFFCRACLQDRPAGEASIDDRYCIPCYQFLEAEATQLLPGRHPKWLPEGVTTPQAPSTALPAAGQTSAPSQNSPTVEKGVLSTSKPNGRPHLSLPEDTIRELAATGLGPKGIAAKLNEQGVKVSSKTIRRAIVRAEGQKNDR